jgi:hypothetical protein
MAVYHEHSRRPPKRVLVVGRLTRLSEKISQRRPPISGSDGYSNTTGSPLPLGIDTLLGLFRRHPSNPSRPLVLRWYVKGKGGQARNGQNPISVLAPNMLSHTLHGDAYELRALQGPLVGRLLVVLYCVLWDV